MGHGYVVGRGTSCRYLLMSHNDPALGTSPLTVKPGKCIHICMYFPVQFYNYIDF